MDYPSFLATAYLLVGVLTILLGLVILHVGAALQHHFIGRQPFLQRMGWGKKERT